MNAFIYLLNMFLWWGKQYVIFFKIIRLRQKKDIHKYIFLFFALAITLFLVFSYFEVYIDIVVICLSTTIMELMVKNKKQTAFVFLGTILVMLVSSIISSIIYKAFNIDPYIWKMSLYNLVYSAIEFDVYCVIGLVLHKFRKEKYFEYELNLKQALFLCVGIVATFFFIDSMLRITFFDITLTQRITAFVTAIMSVAFFVSVCLLALYANINSNKKSIEALEYKYYLDIQKNYYEDLLRVEESTKEFRHDISNHLFCILGLLDRQDIAEVKKYINGLIKKTNSLRKINISGNRIIDIIINDICGSRDDIRLNWKGKIPDNISIDNVDLASIFFNVFSNAINAVEKCSDDKKEINVIAKIINDTLYINIENPYIGEVELNKDGLPETTNEDKVNHGYGSKNIKKIVEKYNGMLEYKIGETFIVEIVLINIVQ